MGLLDRIKQQLGGSHTEPRLRLRRTLGLRREATRRQDRATARRSAYNPRPTSTSLQEHLQERHEALPDDREEFIQHLHHAFRTLAFTWDDLLQANGDFHVAQNWIDALQERLMQFSLLMSCTLDRPVLKARENVYHVQVDLDDSRMLATIARLLDEPQHMI